MMFFKNATMFTFPLSFGPIGEGREKMESLLEDCRLKPVGQLELSSAGFISPYGRDETVLTMATTGAILVTVGIEERILPGAVVNEELAKKVADIEKREGRKISGRARKRLKDDLLLELIPRSFVRMRRIDALIDLDNAVLIVNTGSRKQGEGVVSEIRRAFGTFPALPINAEIAPRSLLTGYVAGESLPEGLALGDECQLEDAMEGGAVVKCQHQEIESEEIHKHLEAGKQCTRLSLSMDDHVEFVITEDLQLKKIKFLDGAVDQLENTERQDMRAEWDARFALMAGEFFRLFGVLRQTFKISKQD